MNKIDVELSPPPPSRNEAPVHQDDLVEVVAAVRNHELEEEAVQNVTETSIRSTRGFAVNPGPHNNSIEPRLFTADDAPLSRHSSDVVAGAGSSSGATGTSSDGGVGNNDGGGAGDTTYSGNYLPANIDIIAEATLVPEEDALKEAEGLDGSLVSEITDPTVLNRTTAGSDSVTASCELVPISTRCNGGGGGGDESSILSTQEVPINSTAAAAAADQSQFSANTIPVATAEPMGKISMTICYRHIRLRWWHFLIVLAIILVIVLPSTLIPRRKRNATEDDWIDKTDDLQSTIQRILIDNSISNPATFNETSSPQYQALNWMGNDGGADTIKVPSEQEATPYIIQRYILGVLYYSTTGSKWRNQFGFLTNVTECEWGVGANNGFNVIDCNSDGFVTLINLWQNNLMGVMPTELVNMTNCTALDFLTNS